jgi:hypothetical protein
MENKFFYNSVELLEEAQRYKTSQKFLEFLFDSLNGSRRLFSVGTGPRLITISSAISQELHCFDVNQGSVDRAKQFIDSWKNYRDHEPFKAEFDFLEKRSLKPRFDNCRFYLGRMPNGFPSQLTKSLDGILASELFLHLNKPEVLGILDVGKQNLNQGGKLVFTVYTLGQPDSLDEKFCNLASLVNINKSDFIINGVIDIQKLKKGLQNAGRYEEHKKLFWLDLDQIKIYAVEEIERWVKDAGLKIHRKEDIRCGMFPFAYRLVYALEK